MAVGRALRQKLLGHQTVYFYCLRSTSEPERSDPRAILLSLARQLSTSEPGTPLLPATKDLYLLHKKEAFASNYISLDDVQTLLFDLAVNYLSITIILDALDECGLDPPSDTPSQIDLLDALDKLVDWSTSDDLPD